MLKTPNLDFHDWEDTLIYSEVSGWISENPAVLS